MNNGWMTWLFLASGPPLLCGPVYSAESGTDLAAAETAVRKADSAWAAAAGTRNIDAWMAFYATDAVVLLPHERLASGQDLIRPSAVRFLSLPHATIEWQVIKVDVSPKGDLAHLVGAYELHFEARGVPMVERGKVLEIWRAQSDGSWRCIVDSWSPEEANAKTTQAQRPGAEDVASNAATYRPRSPSSPATLAAIPSASTDNAADPISPQLRAKYGNKPIHYEDAIRNYFQDHLKDPDSAQYQQITLPEPGEATAIGGILMSEKRQYGWKVKATINAQNASGRYVGFKTYTFLFRGEKMVTALEPIPQGEMN